LLSLRKAIARWPGWLLGGGQIRPRNITHIP